MKKEMSKRMSGNVNSVIHKHEHYISIMHIIYLRYVPWYYRLASVLESLDKKGKDEDFIPWAMGWISSATSLGAGAK